MGHAPFDPCILAIDPGGTTGLAHYIPHNAGTQYLGDFGSAETPNGWEGFDDWFMHVPVLPIAVVIEAFVITPVTAKKTPQYDALYIIGNVLARCRRNYIPVVMQKPAERKFTGDDKLQALGLYRPTPGGHANDAARHLVKYLVRKFPAVRNALGETL